ncbi:MAG: hypothetical protein GY770_35485 [Aestuariibacter sp.]|nr:hypothetical protein [Aestuariibacter sp.]
MLQGIKIKQLPENGLEGAVWVKFAKGLDKSFSRWNSESKDDLLIVLSNKLTLARPAYKRRNNYFGKILNKLFVANPEYIQISGAELITIAKLALEEIEFPVYEDEQYLVPFKEAEKVLHKLYTSINI